MALLREVLVPMFFASGLDQDDGNFREYGLCLVHFISLTLINLY